MLRLISQDEQRFYCPRTWETFFAPSITQKKLVKALAKLDRRLGSRIQQKIAEKEASAAQAMEEFHQLRLKAPDEDEGYFSPLFSPIQFIFMFPFLDEFDVAFAFDTKVPPADRELFMKYYKRIIQRTLYVNGPTKRYLSKAPSNSFRVDALYETFPDAKMIYIARNPLQTIPSQVSFLAHMWHDFCEPLEEYPFRDRILKDSGQFYRYPLERLEGVRPEDSYAIVKYDDLVRDPEPTVVDIYRRLGFDISPEYAQALHEAAEKARRYKSKHVYSLEQMGFTREQLIAEYQDVFDRFGFDTGVEKE